MRRSISILFFALFVNQFLLAQPAFNELSENELEWLENNGLLSTNFSSVSQIGNNNSIVAIQQQEGVLSNTLISRQYQSENSGYIKQVGEAHSTLLVQNGTGNEANIWSEGDLTLTQTWQQGNDNTINSYIDNRGILPKAAALVQIGNNNNIELALIGNGFAWNGWPKAASVTQEGNNLEVVAKLDAYRSPLLIKQQSGTSGGGMSINISNTDFYFPMK